MFIKTVILENFQSHEKSAFNLDKGLNIIVGVSNIGKSSVSRALSLVLFNQWDKSWVRFGSKYCRVTIQTDNDIEVIREKGVAVNKYILKFPNQQDQVFESFGVSVPEPVQQALRIHEVQIDATDSLNLNFAGQMDSLFLLAQTGSYRAKVLGKLSGANYLDFAIRELNREKRQVSAEKSGKDLELIELQGQVDQLIPIENYKEPITDIDTKLTALSAQEARLERIRSLFERVKTFKVAWEQQTAIEALISKIDTSKIAEIALKVDKIKAISTLLSRFTDFEAVNMKQNKLQSLLSQVNLSIIPILIEKNSNVKKIRDISVKLNKNQKELVSKTDELSRVEQQYQEAKEQYSTMLKNAGVCPVCNQPTTEMCNV